jgi:heme-degrading monooxygenase HmoA
MREGATVDETYTCSIWDIDEDKQDLFIDTFQAFARAADESGGTADGMILRDVEDPHRFIVIRRWDSADAVLRWGVASQTHPAGEALRNLVPEATDAFMTTKVASIGS